MGGAMNELVRRLLMLLAMAAVGCVPVEGLSRGWLCECSGIVRRAAAAEKGPAVGLKRGRADGRNELTGRATGGHDMEQPGGPLFGATSPTGDEDRGPASKNFRLHEEV